MKTKDKVNFSLQKMEDGNYLIYVRWSYGYKVTDTISKQVNYQALKFSTGFTLESKSFWDERNCRVKNLESKTKVHINNQLEKIEDRILLLFNDYVRSGILPEPSVLLSQLQNEKAINPLAKRTRFYDFCIRHADESQNSRNTVKGYIQYANKLLQFEESEKRLIYIEEFDRDTYKAFINFLYSLTVRKKIDGKIVVMSRTENDIWRYKTSTKSFLREAKKQKVKIVFDDFENEVKANKIEIDAVWYSEEQLQILFDLDLKKKYSRGKDRTGLENTRLWTLVSSLSGLRYSDWFQMCQPKFQEQVIGKKKIKIVMVRQTKTDTLVKIPIYDRLYELYKRNDFKLPPPATEQKFNEAVKELCKVAGFTENESIRQMRGKNKTKTFTQIPFFQLVGTHTGRRSLANRMYLKGVPPQIIKIYTGHENVKSLLSYLKIKDDELLSNYFEKFHSTIEDSLNV